MHTDDFRFTEIEHKYLVGDDFDLPRFGESLAAIGPNRMKSLRVRDQYYLTEGGPAGGYLVRHRFDAELQQLTIKSLALDTEVRDEINLELGLGAGDQAAQVDAFLTRMGVRWRGTVSKDLRVWDFDDCEVVHYVASTDAQTLRCVEFEATRKASLSDALAVLERFERATGFWGLARSRLSLPQLLFPGLSAHLSR
jgi:hypothetical protein